MPRIGGVRPRVALAIALGMGLVALGIAVGGHGPERAGAEAAGRPPSPAPASAAPAAVAAAGVAVTAPPERGDLRPTEVRVPTLDVRSALVDLDVGPDGALQPPADPDVAGWYVRGGVPGVPGPTVIAGHVDSQAGPAVFYRLDELAAGDRVEVTRSDGQVFAYRVVHGRDRTPRTPSRPPASTARPPARSCG